MQQRFDEAFKGYFGFLDNEYISAALSLVLVLYASMVAPKLPEQVAMWFDNMYVKLIIFFLIAYTGRRNPTAAVIAAVGLMVTLQTVNRFMTNKKIENVVNQVDKKVEGFAPLGNQTEPAQPEKKKDSDEIKCSSLDPNAKHFHQYVSDDMNTYNMKDSTDVGGFNGDWNNDNPEFAGVSE